MLGHLSALPDPLAVFKELTLRGGRGKGGKGRRGERNKNKREWQRRGGRREGVQLICFFLESVDGTEVMTPTPLTTSLLYCRSIGGLTWLPQNNIHLSLLRKTRTPTRSCRIRKRAIISVSPIILRKSRHVVPSLGLICTHPVPAGSRVRPVAVSVAAADCGVGQFSWLKVKYY